MLTQERGKDPPLQCLKNAGRIPGLHNERKQTDYET
jgi:hypothetical protein